jgi:hypothetical protein
MGGHNTACYARGSVDSARYRAVTVRQRYLILSAAPRTRKSKSTVAHDHARPERDA